MVTHAQPAGRIAGRRVNRLATATAIPLLLGTLVLLSGCVAAPGYDQYAGAYAYSYPAYGYFAYDDFGDFDDFHHHDDDHHHFDHDRFDHDGFDHHHFNHNPWGNHHWAHPGPSLWPLQGSTGRQR
jgi:hypothetical protein